MHGMIIEFLSKMGALPPEERVALSRRVGLPQETEALLCLTDEELEELLGGKVEVPPKVHIGGEPGLNYGYMVVNFTGEKTLCFAISPDEPVDWEWVTSEPLLVSASDSDVFVEYCQDGPGDTFALCSLSNGLVGCLATNPGRESSGVFVRLTSAQMQALVNLVNYVRSTRPPELQKKLRFEPKIATEVILF